MLARSFATAIVGYQRYISPYKGFCCAYRVKHGGISCSEFVKQTLLRHGAWQAIPAIRQRFAECKAAATTLGADNTGQRRRRNRGLNESKRREKSGTFDFCDCSSGIELLPSHGCNTFEVAGGGIDACSCTPW
ncbi:membrane protein insertion efficiency factor YidD [Methylocaldum marinum]|uniref:membrane protein insertion efficiency factor YidD n=1 Tax=Methylocaldum marinum TaxID=1432792 RepID=UPI000E691165